MLLKAIEIGAFDGPKYTGFVEMIRQRRDSHQVGTRTRTDILDEQVTEPEIICDGWISAWDEATWWLRGKPDPPICDIPFSEDCKFLADLIDSEAAELEPVAVELKRGVIWVDGIEYSADAQHCQIVKALIDAEGGYVTGPKMNELPVCHGKKIAREIANIEKKIPALKKYLRHEGNKGYRLLR
jgi:hypothetical protein